MTMGGERRGGCRSHPTCWMSRRRAGGTGFFEPGPKLALVVEAGLVLSPCSTCVVFPPARRLNL
jgi:hypothetical protein